MVRAVRRYRVFVLKERKNRRGSEIRKSRPWLVLSPNESNRFLNTAIVAPFTSTYKNYPTRISVILENQEAHLALDQLQTIDQKFIGKMVGELSDEDAKKVARKLQEMFDFGTGK